MQPVPLPHTRRMAPERRRVGRALLATVLGLGVAVPHARAQEPVTSTGTIRGSVVEADNDRPVRGATVVLVQVGGASEPSDPAGTTPRAVTGTRQTDEQGRYAFGHVAPGRYRLEVSGMGYRAARVWIELPAAWSVRRSFALEVEPVELDPVDIRLPPPTPRVAADLAPSSVRPPRMPRGAAAAGSARLYGMDVRVLDPDHLPGVGALGEPDVFRALQRLPGVSARGDFADNLWTRGAPWGMTELLLDGLPLYDPLHVGGVVAGLAADALESVALLPGARPPSMAEGAAGTIALTTRPASGRSATVGVSSMALRAHAEDRILDDRIGVAVTARRSWWDLVSPPPIFASSSSRSNVDYHFADVAGRVDAYAGSLGRIEAGGLWEEDRLHGEVANVVSASDGRWGNRVGWLKLSRSFGAVRSEARVGRVAYRVDTRPLPWSAFFGPDGIPSLQLVETAIDHTGIDLRVSARHAGGRFTWAAGASGVRERLDQRGIDATDRGVPGVDTPTTLDRMRGWWEASLALGPLDLAGGLSFDLAPADVPTPPPLPSVRVRWSPTSWLALEASRGDGIQFLYPLAAAGASPGPSLGAGYLWVLAGDGTPPLVSHTSTAGAALLLPAGVSAHVVGWWRRVDGLWLSGVSRLLHGDLGHVSVVDPFGRERGRGMEVRLGWRGERATAEAAYSLARSRFSDEEGLDWPSPAERRHSVDLFASARVATSFDVSLDFTSESGWPLVLGPSVPCGEEKGGVCIDYPDGEATPDSYSFAEAPRYASLDLRVAWSHSWTHVGMSVAGSVRNLLGRENPAAFRAGTCEGAELVSSVCERTLGMPRFSDGLTRPTPSLAFQLRF